jgi:hypothetical protein
MHSLFNLVDVEQKLGRIEVLYTLPALGSLHHLSGYEVTILIDD